MQEDNPKKSSDRDAQLEEYLRQLRWANVAEAGAKQGAAADVALGRAGAVDLSGVYTEAPKAAIKAYLEERTMKADADALAAKIASKGSSSDLSHQVKNMVDEATGNLVQYNPSKGLYFYRDEEGSEVPVQKAVPIKNFKGPSMSSGAPRTAAPTKTKPATATQTNAASSGIVGNEASRQYEEAVSSGKYDPTSYANFLDQQEWAPNFIKSDTGKEAAAAEDAWIESFLRLASGAAIGDNEREKYGRNFFPRAGDTPQIAENKRKLRQTKMQAVQAGSGPAWTDLNKLEEDQRYTKTLPLAGPVTAPPAQGTSQKTKNYDWAE